MDWGNIKYFTKNEFHRQADYLDDRVIIGLDTLRTNLQERIYISPRKGAVTRRTGSITSQHYVGLPNEEIVRKSTAIDVFIEGIPFNNYINILNSGLFSGIGIYLDTIGVDGKPWCMFHLDVREVPLTWVCTKDFKGKNIYYYPQNNALHWQLLMRRLFFREKEL